MQDEDKKIDILAKRSLDRASGKLPSLSYPPNGIPEGVEDAFVETSFISAPGADEVLKDLLKNG